MRTFRAGVFPFVLAVVLAPRSHALDDVGACYAARVHEPFTLPDGSSQPPSVLRICVVREWSPSQTLYSAFVDGHPVGAFLGRRRCLDRLAQEARPVFQFVRPAGGALRFTGYALTDPGGLLVQTVTTSPNGTAPDGGLVAVSAHGSR